MHSGDTTPVVKSGSKHSEPSLWIQQMDTFETKICFIQDLSQEHGSLLGPCCPCSLGVSPSKAVVLFYWVCGGKWGTGGWQWATDKEDQGARPRPWQSSGIMWPLWLTCWEGVGPASVCRMWAFMGLVVGWAVLGGQRYGVAWPKGLTFLSGISFHSILIISSSWLTS